MEKSHTENLVKNYSNMLIQAAKSVDAGVICVEALEHWQRLKLNEISLAWYLGEGKMELICRDVELSIGIKWKTLFHWLINKTQLEKRLDSRNRKDFAIVIMVENRIEASRLCSKGLRFSGALKVVKKYWDAGSGSVCMTCSCFGYDKLGEYGDKKARYIICAGLSRSNNHKCRTIRCTPVRSKICTQVVLKGANCGGSHQATAFQCPVGQKKKADAWKKKA